MSEEKPAMNKWTPESDPMILRRVGKTGEECAELAKVCSRITIQGIDAAMSAKAGGVCWNKPDLAR